MNPKILEKTEELIKEKNIEKLKNEFLNIPPNELEVCLDFIKNLDYIFSVIENVDLDEETIKKNLIIYLAIYNLARSVVKDEIQVKLKALELIKELDPNIKENVKKVFILLGTYLILQEKIFPSFKVDILIMKHFDEMGIFEIGIWGIKVKWEQALNILETIDEALIEKLNKRYKNLNKDSFLSFYLLFKE
ncbi:MAG: hypothetical protein ACO2O4_01815 [Minisyncoccia bacterium]|jgi:hypothetical protein